MYFNTKNYLKNNHNHTDKYSIERMLLNMCGKTYEHEEILRTCKRQRGNLRIHPDLV